MFLAPLFLANSVLCAAALGASALTRNGRREALIIASLVCANFIFCNMAYTSYAPKYALLALGIECTSKDLWMLADTAVAAAALWLAYDRWWGWSFGLAGLVQLAIHAGRLGLFYDGALYSEMLGIVLHAQLAVFFLLGGPGIVEFLHSSLARFRVPRRPSQASYLDEAGQ